MADFPRWVDQWDVDSQAMLSAFIAYHVEVSEMLKVKHGMSFQPIWEGQLWSIIHEDPPALRGTVTATMLEDPSVAVPARRLSSLRGARGVHVSVVQSLLGEVLQRTPTTRRMGGSGASGN